MIELPPSRISGARAPDIRQGRTGERGPEREPGQAPLPVREGLGRMLVLGAVFVCAACGLVYELELVALASYLFGESVTQASVVLSVMVFAMGVGSLLAKRLRCRAAAAFGLIEAALALIGGSSAMVLYAIFAWCEQWGHSHAALVGFTLLIGMLIGAEVPLLMTLIQRIRRQDAGGAVADLFAADYIGALAGGLAFPFLLLPLLGQLTGALVTGAVNAVAGGVIVLWLFRGDLTVRARWSLITANALVLVLLAAGTLLAGPFEEAARRAVYGPDVRVAVRTDVQEIVLGGDPSGHPRPLSLYLDGRLRVSGHDEFRYHEALVHPAMAGRRDRVLVLGGGDGIALREVLRYPDVRSVTVVDPDAGLLRLARSDPGLSALNRDALRDPRVRAVASDVFGWLRGPGARERRSYDVIVSDLPDPGCTSSAKLYSHEFYGLAGRALTPGGRLAVHAGAAAGGGPRDDDYWTVDATVGSAGLRTVPYRVGGRAGGENGGRGSEREGERAGAWGFVLAERHRPRLRLADDAPRLRSLTSASLRAAGRAAVRPREEGRRPASTLIHPRYGG